jgi:hypothetical protein
MLPQPSLPSSIHLINPSTGIDLYENSDMSGRPERRSSRSIRPLKRTLDESGAAEDTRPRSKRQKTTPRTQFDKDVRLHLTSYTSTRNMYSELLASAPQFERGELEPAYLQAVKDINEIQDMIDEFARKLERKVASLNVNCQQLERSSHASDKWWDHIDIFSPSKLQATPQTQNWTLIHL